MVVQCSDPNSLASECVVRCVRWLRLVVAPVCKSQVCIPHALRSGHSRPWIVQSNCRIHSLASHRELQGGGVCLTRVPPLSTVVSGRLHLDRLDGRMLDVPKHQHWFLFTLTHHSPVPLVWVYKLDPRRAQNTWLQVGTLLMFTE